MAPTQVTQDGLRYVKKNPGSIITTSRAESMMSCFRCGKFMLRPEMTSKRFLGKNHLVCAQRCNSVRTSRACWPTSSCSSRSGRHQF